jgi:hypothetical protein
MPPIKAAFNPDLIRLQFAAVNSNLSNAPYKEKAALSDGLFRLRNLSGGLDTAIP